MFKNASKSFLALNRQLTSAKDKKNAAASFLERSRPNLGMNKTEIEFAVMLEAQKRDGGILRYEFEGITLRWFDMKYTPDFIVFVPDYGHEQENPHPFVKLIEVKGAHIHYQQQAIARFKGARGFWPEFQFEMWQKTKTSWKRKF